MALVNFKKESQDKLKVLIGEVNTEEDLRRLRFTDTFVEKNYYKVTHIIESTDSEGDPQTEYKAIQVNPDGTEVENGVVFDSDQTYTSDVDSPLYLPNLKLNADLFSGSVELGKAYKVEEINPDDFNVEDPIYYIIPKGGGGGASIFRIKCLQDSTISYDGSNSNFSLIDNDDLVIESNVTVTQRKFTTANFYENEILYAQSDEVGYDLSPFLAGIGGTSA
jgi:hypothetical protein